MGMDLKKYISRIQENFKQNVSGLFKKYIWEKGDIKSVYEE